MYKTHKSIYKYILSLILLTIVVLGILYFFNKKETILSIKDNEVTLTYNYDGKSHTVKGQSIEADEAIHIFVPSFYKLDNIAIDSSDGNDYTITQGYYYQDSFSKDIVNENQVSKAIQIKSNNKEIIIHPLENEILSIDLKDGYTLDDIKADKELKVKANIINIDKDGKVLYDGKLEHIKGRGNTSWDKDKKGWSLVFNSNVNLMNLGLNEKYVLIPFMDDMTGIRCKLVFDYAKEIGLKKTNNVEYANVFIDGQYQGIYLLTPHVSNNIQHKKKNQNTELIYENNNIGDLKEIKYFNNQKESNSNNYIIEKDLFGYYRGSSDCAGFVTKRGDAYTIHNSNAMTRDEVYKIAELFQTVENSINDENNIDYLKIIDIDSWAKRYLIEEIFQNSDAFLTSCFYYINIDEPNKIYAGPIWDYEWTMGIGVTKTQNPRVLNLLSVTDHLYNKLCNRKEFMDKVISIYCNELFPNINKLIYYNTENLSKKIKNDMYLNSLLYNQQNGITTNYAYNEYNYDVSIDTLQEHLFEHTKYMNDLYKRYFNQKKVNLITNNFLMRDVCFLVEKGHSFIEDNEVPYYSNGNGFVWNKPLWISKWVDSDGKEFDFTKPITKDIDLYAVWEGDTDAYILQK